MQRLQEKLTRLPELLWRKKYIPGTAVDGQFARTLGSFNLTLLGISSTLGAGIYVLFGSVAKDISGPAIVLSFLLAAVVSLLSGLCYCEFGARVPQSGSAYVYSYIVVGEFVAFSIGWTMIIRIAIAIAAITRSLSGAINQVSNGSLAALGGYVVLGSGYWSIDMWAPIIVLVGTMVVLPGVKTSAIFNATFTVINMCVLAVLVVAGLSYVNASNWKVFAPRGLQGVVEGASSCFFAFVGFEIITLVGGEAKNPSVSLPLSIVLTIVVCTLVYVSTSAVLTLMVPYQYLSVTAAFSEAFAFHHASYGMYVVGFGSIVGLIGCLIASLIPLPRLFFAMASDGLVFKQLAWIWPRNNVPLVATLFGGVLAAILSLCIDLKSLVEIMSIGTLMEYMLVIVCVLLLRYSPDSVGVLRSQEEDVQLSSTNNRSDDCTTRTTPTKATHKRAKIWVMLLLLFLALLALMLRQMMTSSSIGYKIAAGLLTASAVIAVIVIGRLPQNGDPLFFKVPMVPLLPSLALFLNLYLTFSLNLVTWIRMGVWILIGWILYFSYGVRHSHANFESTVSSSSLYEEIA